MKLISLNENKAIKYFGLELVVPRWVMFVSTDKNGMVVGFYAKPEPNDQLNTWTSYGTSITICKADLEGLDWKETLKTIVE